MVEKKLKLSIVIATLNRQSDLLVTLKSILKNSLKPDEVIIVEQGDLKKTKKIISKFKKMSIRVLFFEEKSLARARNFALKHVSGDIIFMFDDDVELDVEYIKNAVSFFEKNMNALAITGRQTNFVKRSLFAKCCLFLFNLESLKKGNALTLSANNSPGDYDLITKNVQWLQGFNMVFRSKAFDHTNFPENFYKWSFNEDVYATYKLYLKYPKSLFYVPSLKIKHFQSQTLRLANYDLIRMKVVYRFIIWKKLKYNLLTIPLFLWSLFGILLIDIILMRNLKVIMPWLESLVYIFKNWKNVDTVNTNSFVFKSNI